MKKKYDKPSIKKVKLVPAEAVLANCKTTGWVGGPTITSCLINVEGIFCLAHGS